jgi:hypothetical protein
MKNKAIGGLILVLFGIAFFVISQIVRYWLNNIVTLNDWLIIRNVLLSLIILSFAFCLFCTCYLRKFWWSGRTSFEIEPELNKMVSISKAEKIENVAYQIFAAILILGFVLFMLWLVPENKGDTDFDPLRFSKDSDAPE